MPTKKREVKIGVVGVDSGQLMVCDPCYIEGEWKSDTNLHLPRVYRDVNTGQLWQWNQDGSELVDGAKPFPGSYMEPIPEYGGLCPNDLTENGTWEEHRVKPSFPEGEFSYAGCCDRTINHPERAGQLVFRLGHDGAGVVFSSGLGDGVYDVYATYEEIPGWGERIVSVRIDLIGCYEEDI